jgi:spermidine synthase
MKDLISRNLILAVVFATGAAILIVEIVATRILAPYFGNTIFTFSSVIGIILAALSCGYYIGGRLADRKPSSALFYGLIFVGGISVLAVKLLAKLLLPNLGYSLSMISGPLIISCILFFLPALLLGTLSPFAIKLQHLRLPEIGIGRISGLVFFWSTLGSILGCLSAGFLLIPHLGVDRIMMSIGCFLSAMGGLGLLANSRRRVTVMTFIFLPAIFFTLAYTILPEGTPSSVLYQQDGIYERIAIQDGTLQNRPVRILMQDLSSNSAMYLDTGRMVFDYTKYYELYRIFTPDLKTVLSIGGGAYSVPKDLLADRPSVHIDIAEIEPSLFSLAKQYFGVREDPHLNNYIQDGRRFLHDTNKKYDMIFSDVYYSFASVPMHCTTHEFFQLALEKLNKNGIFLANFVGSLTPDARPLILSVTKTLRSVFPNIYVFAITDPSSIGPQNFILVGHNSTQRINIETLKTENFQIPILRTLKEKEFKLSQVDLTPYPILTDNYAPVEYLSSKVIRKYNARLRHKKEGRTF